MKITQRFLVRDAAQLLKCRIIGDPEIEISGINEIHRVEHGDLTFVDVAKYYSKALRSKATTIIINQEVECGSGKALLVTDNPFQAYQDLVSHFLPPPSRPKGPYYAADSAQLGEGAVIYPGVYIGERVKIGKNCLIYANAVIYDDAIIGDNVIIHANAVIGGDAFYYKRWPGRFEKMISCGQVIIENDVEIGAGSTIDRGVSAITRIGEGTKIDNLVHVGHGVEIGKRCVIAAQVGIAGKAVIEDEVCLWGQAGIKKGIRVGKGASLGAQSGAGKSLKSNTAYFGTPAIEIEKSFEQLTALRKLPRLLNGLKGKEDKDPLDEGGEQ